MEVRHGWSPTRTRCRPSGRVFFVVACEIDLGNRPSRPDPNATLDANGILYRPDGGKRIGDNALVALTLMIAESRSEEKDVMTKVIVNLINRKN